MKRSRFCFLLVFPLICTMAAAVCTKAAAGQQMNSAPPGAHSSAPSVPPGTIQLDVSVTTKKGEAVGGLQQSDFTVLDDKRPQAITSFREMGVRQEPVRVVLLIDSVNTSYQDVAYERGEIDKFLRMNGGKLAYPTTLAVFSDTGVKVEQNSTTDGNVMAASLQKATIGLRIITRSAGFYGATDRLQLSLQALQAIATNEGRLPGRKIILWLSPGWPLLTGPNIQLTGGQQKGIFNQIVSLSTLLRQQQVTIDAVDPLGVNEGVARTFYYESYLKGVNKPGQANLANLSLQVLAVQSGGEAISSTGISQTLEQCVSEAAPYYRLTFAEPPSEPKDYYHDVEVKVSRPDVTVHTNRGYYGQP